MIASDDPRFARLRGRRVLVTGGAGFIGSHLVRALQAIGAEAVVLDDFSTGLESNVPGGVTLVEASVENEDAVQEAAAGCDVVFHQAAMVSVPQSVDDPARCVSVNVLGTQRVLTAAANASVRRVVFASSCAVYGASPRLPSRETDPVEPASPYAASKAAGELLLRAASATTPLSTVSLRYFNVYGPGQRASGGYAAVISAFAEGLRSGRGVTIHGDGEQTRDFVFVSDVVRANLLAAASERDLGGEAFNVGTGRGASLLEVLGVMREILNREGVVSFGPARAGDVSDSCASMEVMREAMSFDVAVHLHDGMARTVRDQEH
ncbi:MAG: NAD-dependent epimerase/dehydratase family protein [Phycisphaerales bacterium]|nr:MAG: NAD-dependent epimerase/dehydratase family protein [Phycisphaerales bacterium]